ncbi:glycosidase [Thermoplasmatales archaeon SCGC AB-540-F20]|nr:glycosidase [Thermoplasmatales archaeon SCGC AB-540-F20]
MSGVSWFKSAIIYHILIDRFAGFDSTDNWNKSTFLGGNIQGIIKKLPYLNDLGITTIWISPFYKTSAYHGITSLILIRWIPISALWKI